MGTAANNESQSQAPVPQIKTGGTLNRIDAELARVSRFMVYIAAVALFGMMAVVVIDVVGRYAFNHPLMGGNELIGYLMAIAGPWAIAYSQVQKGHIRVDFLLKRFPRKGQAVITSISYIIGAAVFSLLCWRMIARAQYYFGLAHGNTTDTMGLPIAPFVIMVAIGLGMLALVLIFDLIHTLVEVKQK
jgi:TRAP-type C4-dicarboxylate transport system permease small subunit